MKFKVALSTATALGLLMGGAMAGDSNTGVVEQFGNLNTAVIDQDGNNNRVGRADRVGLSPSSYYGQQYRVIQDGDSNSLDVRQVGNANLATGGYSGNLQDSLTQTGDNNQIDIFQVNQGTTYSGNAILRIDQDSDEGTGIANKLTIEQGGYDQRSRNLTRRITQNSIGATADNEITVKQGITSGYVGGDTAHGGGNFLYSLNQTGSGNEQDITQDGRNNFVNTVTQTGDANSATIDQIGHKNVIDSLTQDGDGNEAAVELRGNNNGGSASQNGGAPWAGATDLVIKAFSAGSQAEGVGIAQGVFLQDGNWNNLDHSVTGDDNLAGVQQLGNRNSYIGTVAGGSNELAILQDGDFNFASLVQSGEDNNAGVKVDGNYNATIVTQNGGENKAGVTVAGNANGLWIAQGGDENNATVSITGSGNGFGRLLWGAAGTLAYGNGVGSGLIAQNGDLNNASLTVNGNWNAFASVQNGNGNTTTGTVNGSFNSAAVVQGGNMNTATFAQTGNFNVAAINQ